VENILNMKFFVGLILSAFVLQSLALPAFENMNAPEHMPVKDEAVTPTDEDVEQFRADINYWFTRYQNFYDRANAAMRTYRFNHVDLVTSVQNQMMTVFGDDIHAIRTASNEVRDVIAERQAVLGVGNACLQGVTGRLEEASTNIGSNVQVCTVYANVTLANIMRNLFYPAFANIQVTISSVNTAVIDVLARGNVLEDEEAIIEYLRANYGVIEFQWLTAVSQLLRWESGRYEVDGMFLIDEMTICMADNVLNFVTTTIGLETDARACT